MPDKTLQNALDRLQSIPDKIDDWSFEGVDAKTLLAFLGRRNLVKLINHFAMFKPRLLKKAAQWDPNDHGVDFRTPEEALLWASCKMRQMVRENDKTT